MKRFLAGLCLATLFGCDSASSLPPVQPAKEIGFIDLGDYRGVHVFCDGNRGNLLYYIHIGSEGPALAVVPNGCHVEER